MDAESHVSIQPAAASPGGGMRVCGCLWRVATDDLVLTTWLEFFSRLLMLAVLVGVLVYEEITDFSCASEFHLNVYLIVAIVLFSLTLANLLLLALESAKGAIWDANPQVRRFVAPLVYVNIVLTVGEFVWVVVGTLWVIRGLMNTCIAPGEIVITDIPLYAISLIVILTWVGLFFKVILSCLSFNTLECREKKNVVDNNETLIIDSRPSLRSRIFSLCMKKTQISFFRDIANIFHDVFDDDAFVPTDIAAALILMYAKQSKQNEAVALRRARGDAEASRERAISPTYSNILREDGENLGNLGASDQEPAWDHPEKVKHFMNYAGAAYGYTWFLMRNTQMNLYKMYPHVVCCACCCGCFDDEPGLVENDNCLRCNTAALKAMLPHLEYEDIVHISFKNKMMEVPYFVAIDHKYKKIVVALRGTLSLEDTITDLCAQPESMSSFDETLQGHVVHSGMFKAADYVYQELRSKNTLNKAFSYYDGYQLVVTGHSLGAGTAVILSFMLRRMYPHVKCYSYSPPGGLLNEVAAKESKDFTVSLIIGKDLVGRLSLHSINHLKEKMKKVLRECKLPKYQILASGLGACCIKDWRRSLRADEIVRSESADSTEPILGSSQASPVHANYDSVAQSPEPRSSAPGAASASLRSNSRGQIYEKLVLPGKIFHMERLGEDSQEFKMSEKLPEDFQEVLVSPKMLTDHFPNNVCDVLATINPSTEVI